MFDDTFKFSLWSKQGILRNRDKISKRIKQKAHFKGLIISEEKINT